MALVWGLLTKEGPGVGTLGRAVHACLVPGWVDVESCPFTPPRSCLGLARQIG